MNLDSGVGGEVRVAVCRAELAPPPSGVPAAAAAAAGAGGAAVEAAAGCAAVPGLDLAHSVPLTRCDSIRFETLISECYSCRH